jgi:hypothetical protein
MVKGKLLNGRQGQVIGDIYPTTTYYVKDNKLFTQDHKQIKVFHYIEGLGCQNEQIFIDKVNDIHTWFNQETKDFFTHQCNCGDFFLKPFIL